MQAAVNSSLSSLAASSLCPHPRQRPVFSPLSIQSTNAPTLCGVLTPEFIGVFVNPGFETAVSTPFPGASGRSERRRTRWTCSEPALRVSTPGGVGGVLLGDDPFFFWQGIFCYQVSPRCRCVSLSRLQSCRGESNSSMPYPSHSLA